MSDKPTAIPRQPGPAARTFLLTFDRMVRALFAIEESGLPEKVPLPCLIVANHRRDADIPVLGVFLGRARGTRITGVLPHFVAREDLFDPDFLWRYWRSPWLVLPRLLSPAIPLRRVLEIFKAHPIHRIPEQSLAIVLRDLGRYLGDRRLGAVLNRWWAARLEAAGVDLTQPISALLPRERAFSSLLGGGWGHRRLNLETFREFKPIERARISAHLAVFGRALRAGESVMVAPEGANSPDGHFQRPRAGPFELARTFGHELPVLPVALAYDPTVGERMRVFVHAGELFPASPCEGRQEFDNEVAASILKSTTITGSHLAAHFVLSASPGSEVSADALKAYAARAADGFRRAGLRVPEDAGAHAHRRLQWFARARLLERRDSGFRRTSHVSPRPGWKSRASLATYLRNEFASVASLVPALAAKYRLPPPPYTPLSSRLAPPAAGC